MKLALRALTETVEPGSKNIEIAIMTRDAGVRPVLSQLQLPPSPQSVEPVMIQGVLGHPSPRSVVTGVWQYVDGGYCSIQGDSLYAVLSTLSLMMVHCTSVSLSCIARACPSALSRKHLEHIKVRMT